MPNLQELLPFFQQLIQEWTRFTIANAPYAATLAILVWLLTAIGYSISIAWLNRRYRLEVKAHIETQAGLDAAQQQLQSLQEQISATNAQLEQTAQMLDTKIRDANELEQKLLVGNKKLGQGFAVLVEKFELIENLPAQDTVDAEVLWQRYNAIIERIGERFQNEQQAKARLQLDIQAEKTKIADKELVVASLQSRLDSQAEQLAKLELAVAEQQNLRNELDGARQQLLAAQDRNIVIAARVAELEKQTFASPGAQAQVLMAEKVVAAQPAVIQVETIKSAEPLLVAEVKPVLEDIEQPQATKPVVMNEQPQTQAAEPETTPAIKVQADEPVSGKNKWKNLFGGAKQKVAKTDEKPGSSVEKDIAAQRAVIEKPESVEERKPVEPPKTPAPKAAAKKGKLGSLFEQFSKLDEKLGSPSTPKGQPAQAIDEQSEPVMDGASERVIEAGPEVQAASSSAPQADKKASKIGGFFGKFKKG